MIPLAWLTLAAALAADPTPDAVVDPLALDAVPAADPVLDADAIAVAEWSRDLPSLLGGPFNDADLPRVARALGRLRDAGGKDRLALLASQSDPAIRRAALVALGTTPGGETVLRDALASETDASLRAAIVWGLGRRGDLTDLPTLVAGLPLPFPEGAAAAEAIGVLARRGMDVSPALPALIAAVARPDTRTAEPAAFAIFRARPAALEPSALARLERVWERSPSEAVRAWLAPTILNLDERGRHAWRVQILDSPWRLAKAAILAANVGGPWTDEELSRAQSLDDAWVRARLGDLLGTSGSTDPDAYRRAAVAGGTASSADRAAILAVALQGDVPRLRTASAAAILGSKASTAEVDALSTASDPVVRELVAEQLAQDPTGWTRAGVMIANESDPATLIALLGVLRDGVVPGRSLSPMVRGALVRLATGGAFMVRRRAVEALQAWGGSLYEKPVLPGPPEGLDATLGKVSQIRAARVFTSEGEFRITLEPDDAPFAVAAFAWLAEHGKLDGLSFHRVVPGFVVQTGDARGDGMGGPGWYLPDEIDARPFVAGAVGMATSGPDTGGSQWFVTASVQPHLAGDYTRFGLVSAGMDVVRRIDTEDTVERVIIERVVDPQ